MADEDGNFTDAGKITGYHAHIYYDRTRTRGVAAKLREAIGRHFEVSIGSWHDEPVGPHPIAMYQVAFPATQFAIFVPWLMLNRNGLDVLVHPQTGDSYDDHAKHAVWLGTPQPLRLDVLRRASKAQR